MFSLSVGYAVPEGAERDMKDVIRAELCSSLLHLLQNTPYSLAEAIEVTKTEHEDSALPASAVDAELREIAADVRRRIVLNPLWLAKRRIGFHFFLIDAQHGSLQSLSEHLRGLDGVSEFTLYGRWDALVIFNGLAKDAEQLYEQLINDRRYGVQFFSAKRVWRIRRHSPVPTSAAKEVADVEAVNSLVEDCDSGDDGSMFGRLVEDGIALGATWGVDVPDPCLGAFIGIEIHRATAGNLGSALLDRFVQHADIGPFLVDLYETDRGFPFH